MAGFQGGRKKARFAGRSAGRNSLPAQFGKKRLQHPKRT
jgi:hypothetical protein